jgi:hypothetical protein
VAVFSAFSTARICVRTLPTLVSGSIPTRIDIEEGKKTGDFGGVNPLSY